MRALTVAPGIADSARLEDVADPPQSDGAVLVRTLALGVCGTDREIVSGAYGWAPPGEHRLVIGHESLGSVEEAPAGCGVEAGDHVVGIVRRPDPVPCSACAVDEWDMCRNGRYTERARSWRPRTLLVTGAGPIGLIAAMIGVQRGLDVHVVDHEDHQQKHDLVRSLGAAYHAGGLAKLNGRFKPDILMECSGAPSVVRDVLGRTAPGGIVCLVGVTAPGHDFDIDVGEFNRTMVLDNDTVFGTVNANRRHYELAGEALQRADKAWLNRLITRREPLDRWTQSLERQPDDIKVIVDFS